MDRRKFIHVAFTNLGALALGARLSSAGFGIQERPQQENGTRQLGSSSAQTGTPREIDLVAEIAQFEGPTRGLFERWLYNGQLPGPEIRVQEGERLRITVKNMLPEGTTVHWHGIPLR